MGWYLLKRLLQAIPLLLGIVTATFFMMQLALATPWTSISSPSARRVPVGRKFGEQAAVYRKMLRIEKPRDNK